MAMILLKVVNIISDCGAIFLIKLYFISRIKNDSGLEYSEMLFFDDEHRNKRDLDRIGVLMILVEDGVDKKLIDKGLAEFAARS